MAHRASAFAGMHAVIRVRAPLPSMLSVATTREAHPFLTNPSCFREASTVMCDVRGA